MPGTEKHTKGGLIAHITDATTHAGVRNITPPAELNKWSLLELDSEHRRLHTAGARRAHGILDPDGYSDATEDYFDCLDLQDRADELSANFYGDAS